MERKKRKNSGIHPQNTAKELHMIRQDGDVRMSTNTRPWVQARSRATMTENEELARRGAGTTDEYELLRPMLLAWLRRSAGGASNWGKT
mmetsp:Transcript_24977/g.69417  ORF Transcript_24977/g.69417 Transcript_24977/m.69417 type:complete len:89 (-) Transcript_24977:582-848(-)